MNPINDLGLIIARKWIGGTTVDDAILESVRINKLGESVIINYLGEELKDNSKINKTVATYLEILEQMKKKPVKGSIAVKPTQLGLNVSYKLFLQNYAKIVKRAKVLGIFVWMDMEDHQFVDDSIKAYLEIFKLNKNTGICIQSKLTRSLSDLRKIVPKGAIVRLVKGAYATRKGITYGTKSGVDENYVACMQYLFKNSQRFMIGTHDDKMVEAAMKLQAKYKRKMMFGMLKGIRPNLAMDIVKGGNEMYIYVPFGEDWMDYSLRRLKEKEHSMLVFRSIFQG